VPGVWLAGSPSPKCSCALPSPRQGCSLCQQPLRANPGAHLFWMLLPERWLVLAPPRLQPVLPAQLSEPLQITRRHRAPLPNPLDQAPAVLGGEVERADPCRPALLRDARLRRGGCPSRSRQQHVHKAQFQPRVLSARSHGPGFPSAPALISPRRLRQRRDWK